MKNNKKYFIEKRLTMKYIALYNAVQTSNGASKYFPFP